MTEPRPPAERLLNLVIALLNTSSRMTKDEIRRSVQGYGTNTADAFERMFERDKDALRELGIPLLTVQPSGSSDEIGYRIDPESYTLGELELTPAEIGVLALASGFWQDRTLRAEADRAVTKLRAVAAGAGRDDIATGLMPRIQPAGEALPLLLDAILARRAVRFTYRTGWTGEVLEREVEPWRVLARGAGWYLVGFDRGRGAPRSFRLSRILSDVVAFGPQDEFEIPDDALAVFDSDGGGPEPEREAVLAVLPERAGALRSRARAAGDGDAERHPTRDVLRVTFHSVSGFAGELVGYGHAVVVLEPADLREAVVARLRAATLLDSALTAPDPGTARGADG